MKNVRRMHNKTKFTTKEDGKGGEEDSLLQLPEARTSHCRLPEYKEQTLYLQEALQKEGFESYLRLGERI